MDLSTYCPFSYIARSNKCSSVYYLTKKNILANEVEMPGKGSPAPTAPFSGSNNGYIRYGQGKQICTKGIHDLLQAILLYYEYRVKRKPILKHRICNII